MKNRLYKEEIFAEEKWRRYGRLAYMYSEVFYDATTQKISNRIDIYLSKESPIECYDRAIESYTKSPFTESVEEYHHYGEHFKAIMKDGSAARVGWEITEIEK